MTRILALDAATEACSVALQIDDSVEESFAVMPRLHAQRLLPMIHMLLQKADIALASLDCIAFGRGPGSFTGLRIAAGVVQGLAYGADIPVAPVSTLQTIAQSAINQPDYQRALVVLNAHMGEFYWANFDVSDRQAKLIGEEQLSDAAGISTIESLPEQSTRISRVGLGTGWQFKDGFPDDLVAGLDALHDDAHPHASDMLPFARSCLAQQQLLAAELALPVYLREKTAWKKQQ